MHLTFYFPLSFKICFNNDDLMVTSLTNTGLWMQWISKKLYVIFQGKNMFLTPAHDWLKEYIRDWTLKWYPALMTSTIWYNWSQEVIAMLSVGMTGNCCGPNWRNPTKVLKPGLAPKGTGFGADVLTISRFLTVYNSLVP